MAVVIDANTLSSVFNQSSRDHNDFKPVLKWILYGKALLVIGGSTYFCQLKRLRAIVKLVGELDKLNKVLSLPRNKVDTKECELNEIEDDTDFDDAHIIAMVILSEARVVCSNDRRSFRFIKDPKFYQNPALRPKIYTNLDRRPNISLLCDKNLPVACTSAVILSHEQIRSLGFDL